MTQQVGTVLVVGATGQQGGAVARELLRRGHSVHALTRTVGSDAARDLAAQGATVVEGDLDDHASIRQAMFGVQAVFAVSTFMTPAGVDGEVRQGVTMAQAAKETGVAHVVYTSVDGAERHSGVPHFESKRAIEQQLHELAVPTTVLRPTFFIDNYAGQARPPLVDGTLVVRSALHADTPLQMIATVDIGVFATDAIERPDEYIGQAVTLAGDELTGPQIAEAFQEVTGTPARFDEQPLEEIRTFSEDMAMMFEWFNKVGFSSDQAAIAALRERHPELRTLRTWLAETHWRATT
jgi:uncharacterized protein YbjT (DUF2867 family)